MTNHTQDHPQHSGQEEMKGATSDDWIALADTRIASVRLGVLAGSITAEEGDRRILDALHSLVERVERETLQNFEALFDGGCNCHVCKAHRITVGHAALAAMRSAKLLGNEE